jgi:hypothetical protein
MNINWNDWDIEEKENNNNIIRLTNKKFVKFLNDYNIYDLFIYNIKNKSLIHLEKFCDNINKFQYINSFDWKDTKEGYEFWNNLNIKWLNRLIFGYE